MFTTLCHDVMCEPVGQWANLPSAAQYPPLKTGDQVAAELMKIG
eukprot:SAG31_NODE_23182_length_509_cov_1.253659_2_plen_43_part_01